MPKVNTETDKWLAQIDKKLRILSGLVANSSLANAPIQFTIGDGNPGTPLNGSDTYPNATLDGKNFKVYQNGTGYLTEGVHYDVIDGGGFELLGVDTFATNETFLIWII